MLAVFIVIAVVFVVSSFKDDTGRLARILDADLGILGMAVVAQLACFLATVLTWKKVLLFATGRTVSLRAGLSQTLLANLGKYIPAKLWGMAARGKLLGAPGFDVEEIARAGYLGQILMLLTGFALAFLAAALAFGNYLYWLGLLLALLAIGLFRQGDNVIRLLAQRVPAAGNLLRFFEVRISLFEVLTISVGFVLVWLLLGSTFMLVCTSIIDVELTVASAALFVLSLTAGCLAGSLAVFAPGGVGVREGVGAAVLTSVVSLEEAVLLMLLFRVWVVAAEVLAGAVVLVLPGSGNVAAGKDVG